MAAESYGVPGCGFCSDQFSPYQGAKMPRLRPLLQWIMTPKPTALQFLLNDLHPKSPVPTARDPRLRPHPRRPIVSYSFSVPSGQ